ncbi:MAG: hypothetical protein IKW39_03310, partial [Alphaproteobacteria bacterium]|nr:hypothetical protein [Alphaproteobacteria bacterium]
MTIKKLLFTFTLIITIGFTTQAKALTFAEYIYNNVKANNISSVKKFLNRGYNIDAPGPNGQTALCIALSKNDFATYKKIKELGANTSHHCTKKYSDKTSDKQINTPPKKTPEQTKVTSPSLNSSSIGVGLLVAGGAALALSGGGGGGGGSSSNDNNEETEPEEPPFTCPENYGLLNGECVPINTSTKCLEGEEKVNGKCQKITCKEGYHLVGNSCLKDEEKSDNVEDIDDNIHAPTTNINIENIDTNKDVFGVLSTTNEVYNLFSAYIHPDDYKEINILNKGYGRVIALYGESKTMNSFVDGFRDKSKDEINTKPNGTGKINITNHGTGSVYGVYSRILDAQNQYEAANAYAADEATATGIINIYNDGGSATYGVFSDDRAYNNASRGKASSYGEINIKANGDITGIGAYMAIMNSHSHQFDAGKYAKGNINIESFGNGNIYGVHVQKDIKETVNDHIEQWFAINAAGTYNDDVEGNINIKNSGNGNVYGMYGGQQLYNALFYGAHNGPSISNIVGNINIFNKGKGEVYGMYMPEADAIGKIANISFEGNKREDGTQTSVKSTINIVNLGKGSATGLRGGQFNHIENSGEININSLNKGTVYGIYGERHTNIQNSGLLNLQRQDYTDPKTNTTYTTKGKQQGTIYGIYAQGQADVENSGIINISNASDATGVYLEEGAFLNNMGTITLADNKNARGIYAKEKASVSNSGNINITNSSKGEGIYLEKEASLDNSGTITI